MLRLELPHLSLKEVNTAMSGDVVTSQGADIQRCVFLAHQFLKEEREGLTWKTLLKLWCFPGGIKHPQSCQRFLCPLWHHCSLISRSACFKDVCTQMINGCHGDFTSSTEMSWLEVSLFLLAVKPSLWTSESLGHHVGSTSRPWITFSSCFYLLLNPFDTSVLLSRGWQAKAEQ